MLQFPAAGILTRFHADPLLVGELSLLLAAGAGLLAPIALRLSRLAGPTRPAGYVAWSLRLVTVGVRLIRRR